LKLISKRFHGAFEVVERELLLRRVAPLGLGDEEPMLQQVQLFESLVVRRAQSRQRLPGIDEIGIGAAPCLTC
jgi:hypothetical protein